MFQQDPRQKNCRKRLWLGSYDTEIEAAMTFNVKRQEFEREMALERGDNASVHSEGTAKED